MQVRINAVFQMMNRMVPLRNLAKILTSSQLVPGFFIVPAVVFNFVACTGLQSSSHSLPEHRIRYGCANGEEIGVVFRLQENLAIFSYAGKSAALQQQVVASGIHYSQILWG